MPRRNDTRRRSGCLQCKEKHIKCTEEQPSCMRCKTLGLSCTRGLRLTFREDAVQRGLAFGREGIWAKRPTPKDKSRTRPAFHAISLHTYTNRWIFLNLTTDDFPNKPTPSDQSPNLDCLPLSSPVQIQPSLHHPLHTFPEHASYLLDYFIRGITPSCSLSPSHNPYVSLILPLSFTSDTLRHALLAVAANQLCLLGRPGLRQEACHYKDKALQGLRYQIENGAHDDGTVATVLMLCFQDISDGCSPSWLTHLRGGLHLMDCESSQYCGSPSLKSFFRMYFVAHDIMSRTACDDWRGEESLPLWAEDDDQEEVQPSILFELQSSTYAKRQIDVLMGCSRGLMSLIERVSMVASARAKILRSRLLTVPERDYYATTTTQLHRAIVNLKQTLPAHSQDREDLYQIAHIKRLAAQLYLTERLGGYLERDGSSGNSHHSQPKHALISSLITSITSLADMSQDTNKATLLWPLFILGTASPNNEDHKRFVLDKLMGIQKARNLGSVRRTIEAVKYAFGMKGVGLGTGTGTGTGFRAEGDGAWDCKDQGLRWGCTRWKGISLA